MQVGDNSTLTRLAPVAVPGLSSGVVMVSAGYVRFPFAFGTIVKLLPGKLVLTLVCAGPHVCDRGISWRLVVLGVE